MCFGLIMRFLFFEMPIYVFWLLISIEIFVPFFLFVCNSCLHMMGSITWLAVGCHLSFCFVKVSSDRHSLLILV